jgi:hypothetical protein
MCRESQHPKSPEFLDSFFKIKTLAIFFLIVTPPHALQTARTKSRASRMHIAVFTLHAASRKEPFGEVFARAHAAFAAAGHGDPVIRLAAHDSSFREQLSAARGASKSVSPVARVLKRFPDLARLQRTIPSEIGAADMMTNVAADGSAEPIDPAIVQAIADGVPRSFPFHRITIHLAIPGFGEWDALPTANQVDWRRSLVRAGISGFGGALLQSGVILEDSWWVNGRERSTTAMRIISAPAVGKKLPAPPPAIAACLAACGKIRKTIQFPIADTAQPDFKTSEAGAPILAVVRAWRARLPELARAMPHHVPHQPDSPPLETGSGPKKPALEDAFKRMGYSIRGETGAFILRRRTAANLTIELGLDVGTWSDSLSAHLRVIGMQGETPYRVAISLPPSPGHEAGEVRGVGMYGQIRIASPERWRMFTENLAALVAVLERDFVPEIEAAAGPTPAWFEPEKV